MKADLTKSKISLDESIDNVPIGKRQLELEEKFGGLCHASETRRIYLEDAVGLFKYLQESRDLEHWIDQQLQTALCDDYGVDYEHLLVWFPWCTYQE